MDKMKHNVKRHIAWSEVNETDFPLTRGMFTLKQCDKFMDLVSTRYLCDIEEIDKGSTTNEFFIELTKKLLEDEDIIKMSEDFRDENRSELEEFFLFTYGVMPEGNDFEAFSFEMFLWCMVNEVSRKAYLRETSRDN